MWQPYIESVTALSDNTPVCQYVMRHSVHCMSRIFLYRKVQFTETNGILCSCLLPAHASEQGKVIGLVSVYMCVKKNNRNLAN